MKRMFLFSVFFCAQATAFALTPYNLDVSQISICKVKFSVSGQETLLTTIVALNSKGKVVTEFGSPSGEPFVTHEESEQAKAHLIKTGICPEVRSF